MSTYANHIAIHQALDAAPLLEERGLGSFELSVLICLARHLGKDEPTCWVSYQTIGNECLVSRATAMRAVKKLAKKGFVSSTEVDGRTNVYHVTFTPVAISNQLVAISDQLPLATSSCQPLVLVANSDQPVADSDYTSRCQLPEVVKISSKGSSEVKVVNRSSSDKDEDRSTTTPAYSQSDRRQARELADLYYEHLGSPHRLTIKLATDWPDAFGTLLSDHSSAELRAVIDWAFTIDTFWPTILKGIKRIDPVAYFVDKLPTILDAYAGTAAPKKLAQHSTPTPVDELALGHVKGFPQWKVE